MMFIRWSHPKVGLSTFRENLSHESCTVLLRSYRNDAFRSSPPWALVTPYLIFIYTWWLPAELESTWRKTTTSCHHVCCHSIGLAPVQDSMFEHIDSKTALSIKISLTWMPAQLPGVHRWKVHSTARKLCAALDAFASMQRFCIYIFQALSWYNVIRYHRRGHHLKPFQRIYQGTCRVYSWKYNHSFYTQISEINKDLLRRMRISGYDDIHLSGNHGGLASDRQQLWSVFQLLVCE